MPRESLEKPWMPTGACPRALDPGVGMTKTVGRRVTVNAGWYKRNVGARERVRDFGKEGEPLTTTEKVL
jgi:hypothetical protein